MKNKYSYLVCYTTTTEEGCMVGDINIKTTLKLSFNDLKDTRQIIADKINGEAKKIIITNIIPLRFEKA